MRYKEEVLHREGGEALEQIAQRRVVDAPSLAVFKARLDDALSNLV